MGQKVCNKHFRDPTAEAVFRINGIENTVSPKDENQTGKVRRIIIREKRINKIVFSPFFDTISGMKK